MTNSDVLSEILRQYGTALKANPQLRSLALKAANGSLTVAEAQRAAGLTGKLLGELDAAAAAIRANDGEISGIAMAPAYAADMAKVKENGVTQYPEFRFGARPTSFAGMALDVNTTVPVVASGAKADQVILGNFAGAFRWGYAKEIPLEVIQYGNPDNDATLGDLKGHNQVYLRCEAYLGWGILNPDEFAIIRLA